ncbi:hypothetical protein QJS10_CPA06g00423 [Acorus calamus]|uniref:Uncharacterized protein n=1 Tax=Acorus calamus TaxID=4465 RepID=A0AAV9EM99_ACOCL|nr:hypothetical protein QJS10_CPA06g00423 [Acorus calamus]
MQQVPGCYLSCCYPHHTTTRMEEEWLEMKSSTTRPTSATEKRKLMICHRCSTPNKMVSGDPALRFEAPSLKNSFCRGANRDFCCSRRRLLGLRLQKMWMLVRRHFVLSDFHGGASSGVREGEVAQIWSFQAMGLRLRHLCSGSVRGTWWSSSFCF